MISDWRKGAGIKVSRDFKSCSMKSITTKTLVYSNKRRGYDEAQKHALCQRVSDNDLANTDDIFMMTSHQRVDFSECCYWESILFFVELQLFQCDDVPGLFVSGPKDDSVGPFFYLVEALIAVDGP